MRPNEVVKKPLVYLLILFGEKHYTSIGISGVENAESVGSTNTRCDNLRRWHVNPHRTQIMLLYNLCNQSSFGAIYVICEPLLTVHLLSFTYYLKQGGA
jgi:hypothetical protein